MSSTVAMRAPKGDGTRLRAAVVAGGEGRAFAEAVATFAVALKKDANAVLGAFADELADAARGRAEALRRASSAERQAAVATEFGPRRDGTARLRALMKEAGPNLRRAVYAQLPPYARVDVEDLVPSGIPTTTAPLLNRLAARLLREATR